MRNSGDRSSMLEAMEVVYSFLTQNQPLVKSDLLLVLGNEDRRTAKHAAHVFLQGWAPLVLISGDTGYGTRGKFDRTEAEVFADIMTSYGVPRDKILLEKRSTNTGENIRFSQKLLIEHYNLKPKSIIVATKSIMSLRVALTFDKQWGNSADVNLVVTCPELTLREFPNEDVGSMETVIDYCLHTFEKLSSYAELGFQSSVEIPRTVLDAYHTVVRLRR